MQYQGRIVVVNSHKLRIKWAKFKPHVFSGTTFEFRQTCSQSEKAFDFRADISFLLHTKTFLLPSIFIGKTYYEL